MAGPIFLDRVQESSITTGTGSFALGGASPGFQAWSGVGDGDTAYYMATDGTNWEVGLGTYALSGTTLARTTVLASSNGGAAVSWGAGAKTVSLVAPASWLSALATQAWVSASYATTAAMNTALAAKANLASPALTGTPTGPTAPTGTNTTQLATTAFVAASGLGAGQAWQSVSRALNTSYQNATGKPIAAAIQVINSGAAAAAQVSADNVNWVTIVQGSGAYNPPITWIVPAGYYYRVYTTAGSPGISSWTELR